ncbi:MAG: methyltransferase domain-containing protein [Candidatus Accumulibacter sp.]|jgi:SAM-dependent methyltransferase|nr:methyltransferase domain-containing protein [Accumulibacter sp.]
MTNDYPMSWEDAVAWLRAQPDRRQLVRDCFFDDPLLPAAERYRASTEWSAVRAFLPPRPGKALDLGSGRGIAAFALARDGWETTALEPDPSALVGAGAIRALARQSGVEIGVVEAWGERLPFDDGSFDLVHARQALHHAKDLKALCAEIGRVLKPGGLCIASREHVVSSRDDLPAFLASHPLHTLYGGENAFMLNEYIGALSDAGLSIRRVLSPLESDINLYPDTLADARKRLTAKLRLALPEGFLNRLLAWRGRWSNAPGRLYTFVCTRLPKEERAAEGASAGRPPVGNGSR